MSTRFATSSSVLLAASGSRTERHHRRCVRELQSVLAQLVDYGADLLLRATALRTDLDQRHVGAVVDA